MSDLSFSNNGYTKLCEVMVEEGFSKTDFDSLPVAIRLILHEKILSEKNCPAADIFLKKDNPLLNPRAVKNKNSGKIPAELNSLIKSQENLNQNLKITDLTRRNNSATDRNILYETCLESSKTVFTKDLRLKEVASCLASDKIRSICPLIDDLEEIRQGNISKKYKDKFSAVYNISCASAIGRGLFLFETNAIESKSVLQKQLNGEQIERIAKIGKPETVCLKIRFVGVKKTFNIFEEENYQKKYAKSVKMTKFNSAAALSLSLSANYKNDKLSREEIISFMKHDSHSHAGFLLGLGLKGWLRCLSSLDLYNYFQTQKEIISVALILGYSADAAGSEDNEIFKMISLFIPSLMPSTLIRNELSQRHIVHMTALLSVGLLHFQSKNEQLNKMLIGEIDNSARGLGRNKSGKVFMSGCLSLGLINFGCYPSHLGKNEDWLLNFIEGKTKPVGPKSSNPSFKLTLPSDEIDYCATSPGAYLALGMMYFNTSNRKISHILNQLKNYHRLNSRAEMAFFRSLCYCIINWGCIKSDLKWVAALQIKSPKADLKLYLYRVLGILRAVSLRFVGTHHRNALGLCRAYNQFVDLNKTLIDECCIKNVLVHNALNMALIMAGSGDIKTFQFLRCLRNNENNVISRLCVHRQQIVSMAIGMLFIGGGKCNFNYTDLSVAALLISTIPDFFSRNIILTPTYPFFLRYIWVLSVRSDLMKKKQPQRRQSPENKNQIEIDKNQSRLNETMSDLLFNGKDTMADEYFKEIINNLRRNDDKGLIEKYREIKLFRSLTENEGGLSERRQVYFNLYSLIEEYLKEKKKEEQFQNCLKRIYQRRKSGTIQYDQNIDNSLWRTAV